MASVSLIFRIFGARIDDKFGSGTMADSSNNKTGISTGNTAELKSKKQSWGGPWTEQKLDTFEKYVKAYLAIMNNNRDRYGWKLMYFDGFAGSGSRTSEDENNEIKDTADLFEAEVTQEELSIYQGAAERVVGLEKEGRGFDYYYFVETNDTSRSALQSKLEPYTTEGKKYFLSDDANIAVRKLANTLKKNSKAKALVFLDPFGMQIDWESIKLLEGLSIDLWILIPTGVIVNRLLERNLNKEIGLRHSQKLESFFGLPEKEIVDYFYKEEQLPTLFGDEATVITKTENAIKKIAELYTDRLKTIFPHVTTKPLILYSNHNVPIFHFAFAAKNPTAKKIAQQIIDKQ